MERHYVRIVCDVFVTWSGDQPPIYRIFVDDELLVERTFIWQDVYVEEHLQLELGAGKYCLDFKLIDEHGAEMRVANVRVVQGPATVKKDRIIKVKLKNEMA